MLINQRVVVWVGGLGFPEATIPFIFGNPIGIQTTNPEHQLTMNADKGSHPPKLCP